MWNLIFSLTFISLLATPTPAPLTASASIQLRHASGTPLSGVTVQAMEGARVAGMCVTDGAGRCALSYTLLGFPVMGGKEIGFSDPRLVVNGYNFHPSFGPDGGSDFYVFPMKSGVIVGLVAGVPATKGLVDDAAPDSSKPLPVWSGMRPEQQAQAMATLTAFAPTTSAKATQQIAATLTASAPTPTPMATVQPTLPSGSPTLNIVSRNPTVASTPALTATPSPGSNSFDMTGFIILIIFLVVFIGLIIWSIVAARRKK
jgi:hypothetical protein